MSKIKIVESSQEFLAVVEKSGLLSGNELEMARKACSETDDPKAAARKLLSAGVLTHWQVSQMLAGFAGLVTGKYELLDVIGKGEFGRVYLAEHVTMGQKVALKTLSTKNVADPKVVERFLADAQASSMFEHRNVVRVLDVSSENDRHYVATEYFSGGDLQQRVEKDGPLASRDCAEYVAQAAEGMAYVHGKGVLHRGLKPANLVLNDKGVVKLLDVGVGQLRRDEKPANESTGQILLSSLGYVSPEQARGKETDVRSDIYSLGGTLYFLLTGRVPFSANNEEEQNHVRQTKQPVPISKIKPDAPAELVRLCEEMMALRVSDRPASMEEISRRLRSYLTRAAEAEAPAAADDVEEPVEFEMPLVEPAPAVEIKPLAEQEKPPAEIPPAAEIDSEEKPRPIKDTVKISDTTSFVEAMHTESPPEETPTDPEEETEAPLVGIKIEPKTPAKKSTEPSAAPAGGFKIQKKRKDRPAASDSPLPEGMSATALAQAKRQKSRLIMLAGSIAALLLLGVFALVASMMMNSNKGDVAQKTPSSAKEAPPANASAGTPPVETPPANTPLAPTSDAVPGTAPAGTLAGTPSTTASPTSPATPATPATSADAAAANGPTAPANGTAPPANAANPAGTPPAANAIGAPGTAPSLPAPVVPNTPITNPFATSVAGADQKPATESKPADKPGQPETPKTETKTETKSETPPASNPEAKPEVKPETKPDAKPADKPAEKPAEKPATKSDPKPEAKPDAKDAPKASPTPKVFEIAAAVDLPKLPSSDGVSAAESPAVVLGRIVVDPKEDCFISLFGGESAMKGKSTFSIRSAQGGTAPRDWEFVLTDPANTETVIALLALPQQELKFEWTADGLKNTGSTHLRNCAIRIRAGQEKPYTVALRTPQMDSPASLAGLEKSPVTVKFNFDAVPDSSKLRMEPKISDVKVVFDNGGQTDATKGEQWICFGETKDKSVLRVKVATTVTTKGVQMTLTPHIVMGTEKPQRLTPAIRKSISIAALQEQKTGMDRRKAELDKTPKDKAAQVAAERDVLAIRIKELDSTIQKLTQLEESLKQLNTAMLHLRVYYDAVEAQVDLVRTDSNPPAG